jgi:hypothetical protein
LNGREFDGTFTAADVVPRVVIDALYRSWGDNVIHAPQVVILDPTVIGLRVDATRLVSGDRPGRERPRKTYQAFTTCRRRASVHPNEDGP